MSEDRNQVTVGCKVPRETQQCLKRLAHERYTSVSSLLRGEINELLDEADEVDWEPNQEEAVES